MGRGCGWREAGAEDAAPHMSSSQMSVSIWNISSRAMWRAWWIPWGDLTKEAVVWAASAGKDISAEMSLERRERGMSIVRKPAIRLMKRAKLEFFRKGWG
jgi:hypothetical protein